MRSLNRSPTKSQLLLAHQSHEVQKEDGEPIFQTQHFLDTLIANHRVLPHMSSDSKLAVVGSERPYQRPLKENSSTAADTFTVVEAIRRM